MKVRLKKFLERLKQEDFDGFILSSCANISYLTGFNAVDAYLLVSAKENIYFTDSRHTDKARSCLKGIASLKQTNGSVFGEIAACCKKLNLKRIGFETRQLPYAEYKKIKENLKGHSYLIPAHGLVEGLRQIKDSGELAKIRQALKITGLSLEFIKSFIRPGIKELEIAAELERFIRYQGGYGAAFEIIVAAGPNSAFAHHRPTSRSLQKAEHLLIDLGVDYAGYKSDLTRVFFLDTIKTLARRIYDILLKAQEKAIRGIKPGVEISKIDLLSRNFIAGKGYAKFFTHSLGHGVGLETHEAPVVCAKNDGIFLPGMVVTIEPAVYLPGKFGVRVEDMDLVTEKGCEVLSGAIHK